MLSDDFKIKLFVLYPAFNKVTGPYVRKLDGRKIICLNNSNLSRGDPKKTKTISYPKALVEVREGRLLLDNETTDHIDEDFTNDNLDNLQILTRKANIEKSYGFHPDRHEKYSTHICPQCSKEFIAIARQVRWNNIAMKKAGPFCSRICAGRRNAQMSKGRLAQLAEATDLNPVK